MPRSASHASPYLAHATGRGSRALGCRAPVLQIRVSVEGGMEAKRDAGAGGRASVSLRVPAGVWVASSGEGQVTA